MQAVLDDIQSTVTNELDKVSLERLADINPSLLDEIKRTAQEVMASGNAHAANNNAGASESASSFLVETRSPEWVERSKEWQKLKLNNPVQQAQDIVANLKQHVGSDAVYELTFTQPDAIQMANVLAASSATATLLAKAIEEFEKQDDEAENDLAASSSIPTLHFLLIDKSLFTNDGVKKKDETVISSLYEGGLPFLCKADGKRFRTNQELSDHQDYLFKKG